MEAMDQAKAEVVTIEADIEAEQAVDTEQPPEQEASDAEKIERFIKELVDSGFDANMARKSVNHVDQADIDSCDVTQGKDSRGIDFDGSYEMTFGLTKVRKLRYAKMHYVI